MTTMNKSDAREVIKEIINRNLEGRGILTDRLRVCEECHNDVETMATKRQIEELDRENEALQMAVDEFDIPTLTFDTKALANVLKGVEFKDITKRAKEVVGNE